MLSETYAWEKVPTEGIKHKKKDGDKIHQLQNIVHSKLNTKGNIQCFCCMNDSLYIQLGIAKKHDVKKKF